MDHGSDWLDVLFGIRIALVINAIVYKFTDMWDVNFRILFSNVCLFLCWGSLFSKIEVVLCHSNF